MDLWRANSNAWPLSETIEKHTKGIQVVSWHLSWQGDPGTVKRFFAISVLVVISKQKKEKQDFTCFNCLQTITWSHKEWQLFRLKVPVSRSKRGRACCFTRSFKELQLVITPRPLGLSASNFVGLWLSGVPFSTPSGDTITHLPRYCSQTYPFRMADQAEDQRVRDQCKVLTGLKLPGFNWKANNMRMEFDIFWEALEFVHSGMEIPRKKWYLYNLQQLGREGMEWWTTSIEASVSKEDPVAIINAFKKGYELEETYWTYRSLYLSSEKQGRGELVAALATRVEDLVSMCSGRTIRRNKGA